QLNFNQPTVPNGTAHQPSNTAPVPTSNQDAAPYRPVAVTVQGAQQNPVVAEPTQRVKQFTISIPKAGIENLTVTHPDGPLSSDGILAPLQNGVGHLFSYPGGGGKIMVYGHSSGYPWDVSEYTKIFRKINELNPGDKIYIDYAG